MMSGSPTNNSSNLDKGSRAASVSSACNLCLPASVSNSCAIKLRHDHDHRLIAPASFCVAVDFSLVCPSDSVQGGSFEFSELQY